jgi:hypothetical protein
MMRLSLRMNPWVKAAEADRRQEEREAGIFEVDNGG